MATGAARETCETCGATLHAESPPGLCPACLLTTAIEEGDQEQSISGSRVQDYELLNEVARGGMGIVYRARQRVPPRIVALKMILPAHVGSADAMKRFRAETEAAASLEHEGILPIYAVGEHDGAPFYSMKFAEGGTLADRLGQYRVKPCDAAALVAALARAVAYAHERGILHRDLKPANVLFDAAGKPYVSDFGLAKWLARESNLTETFGVLGTPFYMAPEQAISSHMVTASADVYSLGAILYHLLTGQPPFTGDTPMEVLRRAAEQPAPRPRLTNRGIPPDLETICLKCLEKEPAWRYPSAASLADDLDRFCTGRAVQARRTGIFTRGGKWVQRNPTTAFLAASLVALTAAAGWIVWKSEFIPDKVGITNGIAVLPFENLSPDPDNAYFADGIQEEILTRLTSIADLKVISRTSTQRYQSKPRNLGEIAKQLGVANILEGSVQKAADQVRVNVQLVNAQSDSHLWAETYDRKLTDIFGVESEIAKRIAESLQAKLTGQEQQALAVKPTDNPEAYDAYLRGLAFEARSSYSTDLILKAIGFYERAVELDPKFAIAWARLSRADAFLYFDRKDTATPARRDAAKHALENAQNLEPNSPETLLALGYYQYWALRDYGPAKTTFDRVRKMLPSSSEALFALGRVTRREGNWDQSIAYFEQALALDPHNVALLVVTAWTHAALRQFPAALKLFDRALDVTPNDPDLLASKASIYQVQGNLHGAARFLSAINEQTPSEASVSIKVTQLRLERNYGEAVRLLQIRQAQFHFASQFDKGFDRVALAFAQRLAGDTAGAKITGEQAHNAFEQLYRDQPDNSIFAGWLSQAYAAMGEKDLALKLAEHAIMLLPRAKDAMYGPAREENLALIQMIFGENSPAISILTHLLQTPYNGWLYGLPITPALLRLDPLWEPLRGDPAFQKLCEEKPK
jgi:serine/threonine protein kinase/Tfp pilus assembly protein PilF